MGHVASLRDTPDMASGRIVCDWSANFPLSGYGRIARHPSRVDAKRGDYFLEAHLPVLIRGPFVDSVAESLKGSGYFRTNSWAGLASGTRDKLRRFRNVVACRLLC
jgi:hypothetical protein